jgi:hypothetical protein
MSTIINWMGGDRKSRDIEHKLALMPVHVRVGAPPNCIEDDGTAGAGWYR